MARITNRRAIFAVVLLFAVPGAAGVKYTVTDLGTLGGYNSDATGINDRGQIVGWSFTSFVSAPHPFLYDSTGLHDLGTLGGPIAFGYAINNSGQAIGFSDVSQYGSSNYGTDHAFLYGGGHMTDLGTLGGQNSSAVAINDAGQVVGTADAGQFDLAHAFLYSQGKTTDLTTQLGITTVSGINNRGWMTGTVPDPITFEPHAFLSDGAHVTDLGSLGGGTGLYSSAGQAINAEGEVAGYSDIRGGPTHAFLYAGGHMSDLGALAAKQNSSALALNRFGQVVGWSQTGGADGNGEPITHAFISFGGPMIDLNKLIDPASDWTLYNAEGINDRGQIVGFGRPPGDPYGITAKAGEAFLLTPVSQASDVNHDGVVNFNDLLVLAQNYGLGKGQTLETGDLNGDGKVDFADLLILSQNYGQGGSTSVAVVPEPAALFLLLAAVLTGTRRRRAAS